MPDPILPIGSPGQLQPLANAPAPPNQAAPAQAVSAQTASAEAALVELSQKLSKGQGKTGQASLDEAAKAIREYLKSLPSDLQFLEDRETGHLVFKVINPETREVLRQFPPEAMLEMSRRLQQFIESKDETGILLDRKL